MKRHNAVLLALAAGLGCWAGASGVQAQEGPVHVLDRQRPDYAPVGGRVGSFFIFPKAEVEAEYNSNVYADETDVRDDFIGVLKPSVGVYSIWSRHSLGMRAGADIGRYAEYETENYEDFFVSGDSRLDIFHSAALSGELDLARRHEDRSSPDDVNGETPTEYYDLSGGVKGDYRVSRIALQGNVRYQYLDYEDVESSTGMTINNDDRDRLVGRMGGRVGYEVIPDHLLFLGGEYNNRDYIDAVDDGGVDRDSQGYELELGVQFPVTAIVQGELSGGWQQQFYASDQFEDVGGYAFNAALTWFPTELTTVDLEGGRTIEETTTQGASGYFKSSLRLAVAHELRHNVILRADAGLSQDDYRGIERTDYSYSASVGARYLLNRNFYLGADYRFRQRDSDNDSSDFTRHIMMLRAGVQF